MKRRLTSISFFLLGSVLITAPLAQWFQHTDQRLADTLVVFVIAQSIIGMLAGLAGADV